MNQDNQQQNQWSRAKPILASRGITAPQLMRYAQDKLVRTSHIRRPGQTRGVRLFHLGDIDALITANIETPNKKSPPTAHLEPHACAIHTTKLPQS
jgi:hypothetical protein